jgi:hypothetical protein
MSDTPEGSSPFAAFSPTAGFDMLEKMWRMMQLPGLGGTSSPSAMMSEMMAPMASVEELDKRITDMRAVEQWLKLNLNLLQSAIQTLEVQRATLATLKAFGAFAQSSLEQAAAGTADLGAALRSQAEAAMPPPAEPKAADQTASAAPPLQAIDPTPWWNLLQSQFNQIAAMALAGSAPSAAAGTPGAQPKAASRRAPAAAKDPSSKAGARKGGAARKTGARSAGPPRARGLGPGNNGEPDKGAH